MSAYYCLIAGLPDITIDDNKISYTVSDFKTELENTISDSDRKILNYFFLQFDNKNLLNLLQKKETEWDERGVYSTEELEELILLVKETDTPNDKRFPSYFFLFVSAFLAEKPFHEDLSWEDQLATLYYEYAQKSNNLLVSQWFELNLNINNILTGITCRKYNKELNSFILGDSEISNTIRQSGQRDMGLTGVLDYIDSILLLSEENDLQERERKLDLFRWNWLDNNVFFNYFTIERIFAYLIKLEIIERWVSLNKENGRTIFRSMIDSLKKGIKLPEDI